jgi:3-oxoacyl-[acyl-carrier-protein] synthase II
MGMIRHSMLKRLNETGNDAPESAVRSFDADASGMVHSEGGGLLILEEYEHAKARGARIHAELVGFGASQDAYSVTEPDPSGQSYGKAISKALADANIPPAGVDLLMPFGSGIRQHDQAELNGLSQVFGAGIDRVPMSPIKAQLGSLGAGSSVEAAAALLAVRDNKIPPAINTRKALDNRKLNTAPQTRDKQINVAVTSVYSLGGQNAALVFKKPD